MVSTQRSLNTSDHVEQSLRLLEQTSQMINDAHESAKQYREFIQKAKAYLKHASRSLSEVTSGMTQR